MCAFLALLFLGLGWNATASAAETTLRYFPTGSIYEYRWKLLELALQHTEKSDGPVHLQPYAEEATQNRGMLLLQQGNIDVIALGTNAEREAAMRPVKIDILRGIVGFRVFVIRKTDQERIARMSTAALRKELVFGLNRQWADLPILKANDFLVETSSSYESLFGMLAAGRFDTFPRGLNEAAGELAARKDRFPQLTLEKTKALYFPYPIYFWVNKGNTALAERIERGLKASLTDGSFRKLFETYHAAQITAMRTEKRQVMQLNNPVLPAGAQEPDTSWWWPQ